MKEGKTLQEFAGELKRREDAKRDFLADTDQVSVTSIGPDLVLDLEGVDQRVFVDPLAWRQIGTHLGVPAEFASRRTGKSHGHGWACGKCRKVTQTG